MKTINSNSKVYYIATTAMMACIIMVAIALFRIPIPFTQGYVNLSDGMIFLGVIILGWKYGAVGAGIGSLLGDLLSGFPMWAPWSLVIKAVMAVIFGLILQAASRRAENSETPSYKQFLTFEILGMVLAGAFMAASYFFAEGIMYGNWAIALLGIPWNIAQFVVGIVLAVVMERALEKTNLRSIMAYTAKGRA